MATINYLVRLSAPLILALGLAWLVPVQAATSEAPSGLGNATCLSCHDGKKGKIEVPGGDDTRALYTVGHDKYGKSVHGRMQCVDCHREITDAKASHKKAAGVAGPNCVACHQGLWEALQQEGKTQGKERMGLVVKNVEAYKKSFHARPDKDDPSRPKAVCDQCHNTHEFAVPPRGSVERTEWHATVPQVCGETCHEDALDEYSGSAHGKALQEKQDKKVAVCIDCHTAHNIVNTSGEPFKAAVTKNCGGCHEEKFASYKDTYHGQVNTLGYGYTAKCYNCHGSHEILKADDPGSKVHPDNLLRTCKQCHNGKKDLPEATAGFASFGAHATTHDFKHYPQLWIASKFMVALLIGVFAFFWLHSGLWYYREAKDRKAGKAAPHIRTEGLALDEKKHFRRFHWGWRLGHLSFALVTMTLVLTGTAALYAESSWAPVVAGMFGSPHAMGLTHRVAAALFVGIFLIHFVYVMQKLLRDKTFRWFGPDSLIPRWKDLSDCVGMFKWFVGKGPRPQFDRWAYFEKFDYWAVFWGVNIIGWSGLMMAFPHVTASYLPGWVFNVIMLVHGEEAFLAAVFLFTVHFFNNHFRPDKLPPPDVVMFTGTQSLEEFRRDHPAQYQRLVESGELEKHLVDAPSLVMTLGSKILGLTLITIGLGLLVLVAIGFMGH
ncbi:cytochrome C [Denitratisoma oestradiolicum]|uniref:Cytochrome C n=1 Tax=Denitratisoma oestradiolicum TaxID=311182 RepID=A0A6S6XX31_9PROT|nr:cytochrome C [Denitratisoma oestradiolicum]TWO80851.1 cytochrome C [Denitratisoma oestradiolicum]CAB1367399.1 Cytochrome C [Denitratisoma oestradiolicum]